MQLGDRVRLIKSPDKDLDFLIGRDAVVVAVHPGFMFEVEFQTADGKEPLISMLVTDEHVERLE